ncbi:MAG: hypothetical protein QOF60_2248 [Actinomycetota bacterium]|nr:hypothetical protein [Actinomycetota bacterium]
MTSADDDEELAPANITCIDCGGRCHLLTIFDDENPPMPGDLITYRCEDCLDRWDLLVPGGDEDT